MSVSEQEHQVTCPLIATLLIGILTQVSEDAVESTGDPEELVVLDEVYSDESEEEKEVCVCSSLFCLYQQ